MLQFAVHGNSLYVCVGLAHESAPMYLQCVSTGVFYYFQVSNAGMLSTGSFSRYAESTRVNTRRTAATHR